MNKKTAERIGLAGFRDELEVLLRKYNVTIVTYNGGEVSIEYCDWNKTWDKYLIQDDGDAHFHYGQASKEDMEDREAGKWKKVMRISEKKTGYEDG